MGLSFCMGKLEEAMTYSQERQDLFVLSLIGDNGTFLDVGCCWPIKFNNTYLLEEHGWTGVSIDIDNYAEEWKCRKNPFTHADALEYDYTSLSPYYDYLSLDLEGDGTRYKALSRIIEAGLSFRVITIEHDAYAGYDLTERVPQRKLLHSKGYTLIKPDVRSNGYVFEDWWVML